MQTVKCKKCDSEIILTSDEKEELIKWKEKGEICFRCVMRDSYKKRHEQKSMPKQKDEKESKPVDEKEMLIKEKFERLLELREQYFNFMYGKDRKGGVIKEINDLFDTDLFEVFEYYKCDYFEFFGMAEGDGLTWNILIDLIKKYKKNHRD